MNRWKIILALLSILSLLGIVLYAAGIRPEHMTAIVALFAVSGMVAILYTMPQPADGVNLLALSAIPPMAWKILSIPAAALVGWLYAGAVGSMAAIVATAVILWKMSGGKLALSATTIDERAEALKQSKTLWWSSFGPELVNVVLIASWAYSLHSNPYVGSGIAVAFLCFVAMRVVSVPAAVNAFARRDWWRGFSMTGLALLTTVALLVATVFETVNDSGKVTDAKIEASDEAAALDNDIQKARDELAKVSKYADAGQVQTEAEGIAKAEASRQARIGELNAAIAAKLAAIPTNQDGKKASKSLSSLTSGCTSTSWYTTTYCGDVAALRSELDSLQSGGATGGAYAAGHSDYQGKKAYLEQLETKRKVLGNGSANVRQAYRPDDRLVAEFAGIDVLKAMWWKMIALGIFLDLLTLWSRFNSQQLKLIAGGDKRAEMKRKVSAMLNYAEAFGLDIDRVLPGNLPNQPVGNLPNQPSAPPPSYRYGGPVKHHGIAEVHGTEEEPEYVLTPEMVKAVGGLDPLEKLRQRIHGSQTETPRFHRETSGFHSETPRETAGFQTETTQPETPPGSGGNVRGEDAEKKCVKEAALKWVKALKSAKPRGQKNTPVKVTIRQARAELGCRTSDISDVIFPELMEAGLLTVEYSQSGKITGYYY